MSKSEQCDVVLVGAAFMDLQVYPVGKDIAELSSYSAQTMVWAVGGDAMNEATIITRLGHKVRLVSCLGDDMIGAMVLEHCRRNRIDTSCVKLDRDKITSVNIGLIWKDGERTFINNRSGSIWTFGPQDVDLDAIKDAKILSMASIFNSPCLDAAWMGRLFKKAKEQGMLVCADVVSPKNGETLDDIRDIVSYIDYFFPNYEEAVRLTGKKDIDEIADVFLGLGIKNVILKIGKDGCLVKNASQRFIVPGYPKSNCIDTTGAGDNFASGFISGLLEGRDLKACAELANCTASIAVEAVGATNGVTDRGQVQARYADYLKVWENE